MSDWIKWEGGERPVHKNTLVEVKLRCGEIRKGSDWVAASWHHKGEHKHHLDDYDVVAYRLVGQGTLEEAYEDADRPISDGYVDSALNYQVKGDHYKQFEIQPIEFINANNLDFLAGNIVKYISRHKLKGGADDVKKAIHYCKLILELQYGEKE